MEFVGLLSKWILNLDNGQAVEIWADSYSEQADHIVFSALIDADFDEQVVLDITGRTPSNPRRVVVTLARFPTAIVVEVLSA